ncbi:hypothetical protein Hanom_Chr16g01430971 [Helianthus anomalus]
MHVTVEKNVGLCCQFCKLGYVVSLQIGLMLDYVFANWVNVGLCWLCFCEFGLC